MAQHYLTTEERYERIEAAICSRSEEVANAVVIDLRDLSTVEDTMMVDGFDDGERPPYVDVAELLAGGLPDPPKPEVCCRSDGHGLFYKGQVNTVFGDPETGKSWLGYAALAETLLRDGRAVLIDADHNGAAQVVRRFVDLGVPAATLANPQLFRLYEPEDAVTLKSAVSDARKFNPETVVVDSVGEMVPLLGLNSNLPDDYTKAHRTVLRPLAIAGACVISIDHLSKDPISRRGGPTGTSAKRRAIGGTAIRVTLREAFAPGRGGKAVLTIHKDRPGGLRAVSPSGGDEPTAGVFVLTPAGDGLRWEITPPSAGDVLSSSQIAGKSPYEVTSEELAFVEALDDVDRRSVRALMKAASWGTDRASTVLKAWREGRSSVPGGVPEEHGTPARE